MPSSSIPSAQYRTARNIAPLLAAVGAAALSLGAIAALRWRPAQIDQPKHVAMMIGARAIELDRRYLYSPPQRAGGRTDRADLLLSWPDFGPAKIVMRDERGHATPAPSSLHVLASLRMAEGSDPAGRALAVHGRFVEPEIWSNPGGLIARRFKVNSPYEGEELIMTPDGREFAARCPIASQARDDLPPRCLTTVRLADIDVTVSFDPALLPEWKRLKDGVVDVVARALR